MKYTIAENITLSISKRIGNAIGTFVKKRETEFGKETFAYVSLTKILAKAY